MARLFVVVALATGASACANTEEVEIRDHRGICVGVSARLCTQTRAPGAEQWQYMYAGIGGLSPKWGHRYRIIMTVTEVSDPPEDGSSLRYDLDEILEDEPVEPGTTFDLDIPLSTIADPLIERSGDLDGSLFSKDFVCASTEVCSQIDAALASGNDFLVTFEYGEPVERVLIAIGVSDANGDAVAP